MHHQGIFSASSVQHQCSPTALSVHHHCIICASSAHQDCIQTVSSVHHQCIISASLAHHQRIISESSAHHQCIISASSARGLYSTLFQEKPPEIKLLFWADFIENWAPFIENSILTIFTDSKAKRSENVLNNQIQSHFKPLYKINHMCQNDSCSTNNRRIL